MPRIVQEAQEFPDWCELRAFAMLRPGDGPATVLMSRSSERVLAVKGSVNVNQGVRGIVLAQGQFLDLDVQSGPASVTAVSSGAEAMHLSGTWGLRLGGCGVFTATDVATPTDRGDPVPYPKTTNIDSHYHDCDEYWIMLEGRATVVVAGEAAEVGPGDCLCIGTGRHHDMPHAPEAVRAVYFETSLTGAMRLGHLWNHTHGKAVATNGRD
jgi:mannose-6-phosphate isomerase-like protein (cupin superfamily)